MPGPILLDHLFALAVFIIYPIYAARSFPAFLQDIRERGSVARIHGYRTTIITWLLFTAILLLGWHFSDRAWSDLGLRSGDPFRQLLALAVAGIVTAVIVLPIRAMANDADKAARLGDQLEDLFLFMPGTAEEEQWFRGVSVNAGVTEELVFRGYLIWYLAQYLDAWAVAILAVILFTGAHAYQGLKQVPAFAFVSAVTVGLYLYTESLLIPIVFHIVLDLLQGYYVSRIPRGSRNEIA